MSSLCVALKATWLALEVSAPRWTGVVGDFYDGLT